MAQSQSHDNTYHGLEIERKNNNNVTFSRIEANWAENLKTKMEKKKPRKTNPGIEFY